MVPANGMDYILVLVIIAILPLKLGNIVAGRIPRRHHLGFPASLIAAVATTFLWFGFSMWTRSYSETDSPGWQAAEWWAQTGKWYFFGIAGCLSRRRVATRKLSTGPPPRSSPFSAVLAFLWITVWRTYPVYAFLPRGMVRDKTGCLRQTVPYTCGPVSLANLLDTMACRTAGLPSASSRASQEQLAKEPP